MRFLDKYIFLEGYRSSGAWRIEPRLQLPYSAKYHDTVGEANSDGPIRRSSGRSGSEGNAKLRRARAKVRVVRARGSTNGMVFTNANKHSYQLQNDSPPQSAYRAASRAGRTRAAVATSRFAARVSLSSPLLPPFPPLPFLFVMKLLFHPHPREI